MRGGQLLHDLMRPLTEHSAKSLTQKGSTTGLKISNIFGYFKVTLPGVIFEQGILGKKYGASRSNTTGNEVDNVSDLKVFPTAPTIV